MVVRPTTERPTSNGVPKIRRSQETFLTLDGVTVFVTIARYFQQPWETSDLGLLLETKGFAFLAVSVNFPKSHYESAALTAELRARNLFITTI